MQKISTMQTSRKSLFQGQLTIGVDLGDRSSAYCVLNEGGEIVLEHKVATTPEAMKQVFGSMPRCRMAMETGTHSPWVSQLLTALGHEVIVAHAQKAQLHLTEIRARAVLVSARTALVNAARGLVKSYGERLRKCGTEQFRRETASELSPECVRPWSRCCERGNR
jgi:transposase